MVILLNTVSFRVSFIQIMKIRVQNKRKSVRKSRYAEDVSGHSVNNAISITIKLIQHVNDDNYLGL